MPRVIRLPDGTYEVRISVVDPSTGKRHQPRIRARSRRELERAVAEARVAIRRGEVSEPDTTPLGVWLDTWLATYRASPSSRATRQGAVRRIQRDEVARITLGRLRRAHVQALVDRLAATYAPRTVQATMTTLGMALDRAVRLDVIATSPADRLDIPRVTRRPMAVWSDAEARRFLDATQDEPEAALWMLAVMLGLRIGELVALRWPDINIEAGRLSVHRTLTHDERGRCYIGETTKTAASQRTIALPLPVTAALSRHRRRSLERRLALGDLYEPDDAVFDDGAGAHWVTDARFRRLLPLLCERAGVPIIRLHDLRHTAASHMLRAGVPITTVAQILGHASAAVTLGIYGHVVRAMQDEAADRIGRMYEARETG